MSFDNDGFLIIRNAVQHIDRIEEIVTKLYRVQAFKIKEYAHMLHPECTLPEICEAMESNDKEALYQVQKLIPVAINLRSIIDTMNIFVNPCEISFKDEDLWLMDGPGLFINRPHTDRLLYKWHSEQHYYPKRRNFLNVWFPLFTDKTKENGTMSFKVGSHKKVYPFSEYRGYGKDTENKPNHFVQYEIPDNFHAEFEEYHCESRRGEMVVFHSNLIHRSNPNLSDHYSFAMVARIWNPADDLTLSGTFAATPYGNDIGRADLIVNP